MIKICSLRDPENLAAIAALGPAYMGFDFRSESRWYVGQVDETLLRPVGSGIRKVGVFGEDNTLSILSVAGRFSLNAVQIEGEKSSDALEILAAEGLEVIKVITLSSAGAFYEAGRYEGVVNKFIFRVPSPQQVPLVGEYGGRTPFMVSADWSCVSLERVLGVGHELMCGMDSWISFERRTGCKDLERVEGFMKMVDGKLLFR